MAMSYGECFRLIEQLRPPGRIWEIGVCTRVQGGTVETTWSFYCVGATNEPIMFDDIPSPQALVDAVSTSLGTAATTIESVGEAVS